MGWFWCFQRNVKSNFIGTSSFTFGPFLLCMFVCCARDDCWIVLIRRNFGTIHLRFITSVSNPLLWSLPLATWLVPLTSGTFIIMIYSISVQKDCKICYPLRGQYRGTMCLGALKFITLISELKLFQIYSGRICSLVAA